MTIEELMAEAHATATEKGWHEEGADMTRLPTMLMMMVSELAEALEEYRAGCGFGLYMRDGKPEGVVVELADVLIRIADTCKFYGMDLPYALRLKLDYNRTRAHRHGGKLC